MAKHIDQDDFILTLLKANDQQALDLLFELYFDPLLNRAFRYVRDRQAAKDIVQELFINVWTERHRLNIRKPIKNYLERAIRNRSLNFIRDREKFQNNVNKGGELISSQDIFRYPADAALRRDELEGKIQLAIDSLPDKLRQPFLLSRNTDMTHKEIAGHLQVSEVVVEKRIIKALKLIRESLKLYLKN